MSTRPVLFPLFLKLDGRSCLVIGANPETEGKIHNLLASGANVRVVSTTVTAGVRELADNSRIDLQQREFRPTDLEDVTLALALHEDDAVNEQIYREAEARGILCNIVDQPERCNFYYPAVVRRGHLQIAISTGGLSPALASDLRKELDNRFDPEYADWIEALGKARQRVLRTLPRSPRRTRLLQRIASKRAFQNYQAAHSRGGQEQP